MRILHIAWGFTPWRGGGLIDYTEDLMAIQQAHGHEVAYFCAGRRNPFTSTPKLKRRLARNIHTYEIINSPIYHSADDGTMNPMMELYEPHSERFFLEVLDEFKPDVIHIQELMGLPTSLIELAKLNDIPIIQTLHDYYPLCPTVKLYEESGAFCVERKVGDKCVGCNAKATQPDRFNRIGAALHYAEIRPGLQRTPAKIVHQAMKMIGTVPMKLARGLSARKSQQSMLKPVEENRELAAAFQQRRETNIERLNQLDVLITQSKRQAELYELLGVEREKLLIIPSTQKHIEHLRPKVLESISHPVNFATLNGCNTSRKGAHLVLNALRLLQAQGLAQQFNLYVLGPVAPEIQDELNRFENVICKGRYGLNDLEGLLEDVHVGIIPSVWEEAYGIVGIELLAKGIPIIGNKLGGIVDYTIDDVTGWVNQTNTAEGLAQIMAAIISDPKQIVRLNRSIRLNRARLVKSMKTHFDEMEEIYQELLRRKQGRMTVGATEFASENYSVKSVEMAGVSEQT